MSETDDFRAALAAEYGQYVATQNIYVGGALAYVAGQAVPVSNVRLYGYDTEGVVRSVAEQQAESSQSADVTVVPPAPVE